MNNCPHVDIEELLAELKGKGEHWPDTLQQKLEGACGRRGKAIGGITLQAYVDAIAPKHIIATKENRKPRAQDAIMKDITVAVDALMYTIDFDAFMQELDDQTDNWRLILSQKLSSRT